MWRVGHCMAHGAIVIDWPQVIHSALGIGVITANAEREQLAPVRRGKVPERHFYSLWGG